MTSSSERDSSHAAHRARIGIEVIGTWEDGWCSSASDPNPYIQVFFGTFRQKINTINFLAFLTLGTDIYRRAHIFLSYTFQAGLDLVYSGWPMILSTIIVLF